MIVLFDLDGVLFDTEQLVRDAYREVGVVPPANLFACEGDTWLTEQVGPRADGIREEKNDVLQERLSRDLELHTKLRLPPLATAAYLRTEGHTTGVLTAQPMSTVVMLMRWQTWPFTITHGGMRTPEKMRFIRRAFNLQFGVYIDDQDRFIDLPPTWRFVRYVGQSTEELFEEVRK